MKLLKNLDEFNELIQNNNKVVIDFFANWCGPCHIISPCYEELSNKYINITFVKVNIDEAQDIADKCNISCMPTFHFYNNKMKINELNGANHIQLKDYVDILERK